MPVTLSPNAPFVRFYVKTQISPLAVSWCESIPGVRAFRAKAGNRNNIPVGEVDCIQSPVNANWIVEQILTQHGVQFGVWCPPAPVNEFTGFKGMRSHINGLTLEEFLLTYQKREVAKWMHYNSVMFQWPTGSGKSAGAILWALAASGPIVIMTGAKGRSNWVKSIERFTKEKSYTLIGQEFGEEVDVQIPQASVRAKGDKLGLAAFRKLRKEIEGYVADGHYFNCLCGEIHAPKTVVQKREKDQAGNAVLRLFLRFCLHPGRHTLFYGAVNGLESPVAILNVVEPEIPSEARFVICSWETLAWQIDKLCALRPATIILDEPHRIAKSHKRVQKVPALPEEQGAKLLSDGTWAKFLKLENVAASTKRLRDHADRCIELTWTPMKDRPRDLWALYDYLTPGSFGKYHDFSKRYCGGYQTNLGHYVDKGHSNIEELKARATYFTSFVSEEEAKANLPPLIRETIFLPPEVLGEEDPEFRKELEQAEMAVAGGHGSTKTVAEARLAVAGSRKRKALVEEFIEAVLEGKKVLLFTTRRRDVKVLYALVQSKLAKLRDISPVKIWAADGDDTVEKRDIIIDEYMALPSHGGLIGTGYAFGEQVNLQETDLMMIGTLPWTITDILQWEGRCVVEGQFVPTARGAVLIEEVKVGDLALTHRGRYRKVLAINSRMVQPFGEATTALTELEFTGKIKPLRVTFDHKTLIRRGKDVAAQWVLTHTVLPGDSVVTPRMKIEVDPTPKLVFPAEFRSNHPNVKNRPKNVIDVTEEVAWLFGYFLGDGSTAMSAGTNQLWFSGNTAGKMKHLEKAERILQSWGMHTTRKKNADSTGADVVVASIELARWFRSMFGPKSHLKKIPESVFTWPTHLKEVFLVGYKNADGRTESVNREWSTTSPHIAVQLPLLLAMLGRGTSCSYSERAKPRKPLWTVGESIDGIEVDQDYVYRRVTKVTTRLPEKSSIRVHDLTVEEDHSFVVGNAVVHNCHRQGGTRNVSIKAYVAEGTYDEKISSIILEKLPPFEKMDSGKTAEGLREGLVGDQEAMLNSIAHEIMSTQTDLELKD